MSSVSDRSEAEQLIIDLVKIETENPPGNERPCAEFIAEWFEERDIEAELVMDPEPERPQVVAQVGSGNPTVVLNGHLDVVPAGNQFEWNHPPYKGEIENGALYGRGSTDMKAGIALAMLATAHVSESLKSKNIDGAVLFHGVMGEETGEPGTKRLLELGYDGDYGIVLEPTGLRVGTRTKGTAWYNITIKGDQSHASRPDQGTNAVANARPVLEALDRYDERVRERVDELLGSAYATVTEFHAGTKENIVPEQAEITLDRRVLPSEDFDEIDTELDKLLTEVANEHDFEIGWEQFMTYEPCAIDDNSPLAETFREHASDVAAVSTEPWAIPAATDTRNFVNDGDIEAITWGPGKLVQAHTVDERLELEQAAQGIEVLERAIRDLLRQNSN
jgi:succinyl-diaminopimelate desuccinylase